HKPEYCPFSTFFPRPRRLPYGELCQPVLPSYGRVLPGLVRNPGVHPFPTCVTGPKARFLHPEQSALQLCPHGRTLLRKRWPVPAPFHLQNAIGTAQIFFPVGAG